MGKKLTLWPLVMAVFFCVSGGPYGLEPVMQSGIGLGIASPALTSLMAGSVETADLGVAGAMQLLQYMLTSESEVTPSEADLFIYHTF